MAEVPAGQEAPAPTPSTPSPRNILIETARKRIRDTATVLTEIDISLSSEAEAGNQTARRICELQSQYQSPPSQQIERTAEEVIFQETLSKKIEKDLPKEGDPEERFQALQTLIATFTQEYGLTRIPKSGDLVEYHPRPQQGKEIKIAPHTFVAKTDGTIISLGIKAPGATSFFAGVSANEPNLRALMRFFAM
jgi:hypothetical protein